MNEETALPNATAEGRIDAPANLGAILWFQLEDGFLSGFATVLDSDSKTKEPTGLIHASREAAIIQAAEDIVSWCSDQKERGTKKHRKQAAQLQDWALERARLAQLALVPVDTRVIDLPPAEVGQVQTVDPPIELRAGELIRLKSTVTINDEQPQTFAQGIAPGDKPDEQTDSAPYTITITGSSLTPPPAIITFTPPDNAPRLIALAELHESPWNPRQHYPEAPLAELAESMRANGFRDWLPLVVRLRVTDDPATTTGYEIAAGHRRARAARMAGLTHVPCLVRAMSDAELLDVLNFDNSGREDVHPLHEAAGWRTWMEKTGGFAPDIAARIGQSERFVYDRLKCLELIPQGQQLFLDGALNVAHAREIARLEPAEQRAALEYCCPAYDPDRVVTTRELASWIEGRRKAREEQERIAQSPLSTEPVAQPEAEPEPAPAPVAEEPAAPAVEIPAGPSLNQVVDSERDADRALRKSEKDRKDWEAQQRAIDEKAREEKAADEAKRMVRAKLIYRRTVETICAKANFPASLEATREMCMVVIESLDGGDPCDLAADMYRIPKKGGSVRQRDIEAALYRLPPATLVRVTLAAMLLDIGDKLQWADNTMVISLASAHKVDRVKVAREIDAELNPKPVVPAKDRKAAISKLGTLNTPAPKKSAPAAKKAAAPAKKAAAKASPKGKGKK